MKEQLKKYPVVIRWSEIDNAYIAEMPDLPYTAADGTTREEALSNLYRAAEQWLLTAKEKGWTIPQPAAGRQAAA